jgi:hypothetical protein
MEKILFEKKIDHSDDSNSIIKSCPKRHIYDISLNVSGHNVFKYKGFCKNWLCKRTQSRKIGMEKAIKCSILTTM